MYIAGHNCFVAYAPETNAITESPDGTTAATLPDVPTTFTVVGYTNVPERRVGLNNTWGKGIGTPYGQYRKRGAVVPSVNITLKAGSVGLLSAINRTNDVLPSLAIAIGVPGVWTDVFRFCKVNKLTINGRESTAEASEIEFQLEIWGTAVQGLATPLNPTTSSILALGAPLMWHDARVFSLADSTGTAVDLRPNLMSFSAVINHNLERKANRPNWGDNQPLSRTSYSMLEHIIEPSGELTLHDRLPASLRNATVNAQDWGDLTIGISTPTGITPARAVNMALTKLFPSEFVGAGVEASAQQSYSVPFTAQNFTLATT